MFSGFGGVGSYLTPFLHHWRVVFQRRHFTSLAQLLQASLDSFVDFYNHRQPYRGYRLKGPVPAQLFFGATAVNR